MTIVIKRVLASTLKEMAEKKSLSKITINDLTQACDVSRQTFYNNFKDIYDLVEWIYLKEVVTPSCFCFKYLSLFWKRIFRKSTKTGD